MLMLLVACATGDPPADRTRPGGPGAPADDGPETDTEEGPLGVCINELMPATLASTRDEKGAVSDWIELHNPTDQDLALDGWSMTDDPDDPRKHALADGLVLEAGGFLVLWADASLDQGPTHLGFSLPEEGGAVGLFAPDGSGTVVRYVGSIRDVAVARSADCCFEEAAGCLTHVFAGTPGATNGV